MLGDFIAATAEEELLPAYDGDREVQFLSNVFTAVIRSSRDRRLNAGPKGLLETGIRRVIHGRIEHRGVVDKYRYPDCYVEELIKGFDAYLPKFRRMVSVWLHEDQAHIFPIDYHTEIIRSKFVYTEHPMRSFVQYLDDLEHIKETDPNQYRRNLVMRRAVTALHRVGLAILPPETWDARIRFLGPNGADQQCADLPAVPGNASEGPNLVQAAQH